jgi:hypothetical protein
MKKSSSLLKGCVAVLCLSFAGCQSLDEKPQGFIGPANFYTTVAQGEAALAGAMNNLWDYWNGYEYSGVGLFRHDDQLEGGNLDIPIGFGTDLWNRHYAAIKDINGVLGGIGNMDAGQSEEDIAQLVGQAKFLRAWNYFMLVRLFGDLPLITEETALPFTGAVKVRTSALEVYNTLIVPDLEEAIEKLPSLTDSGVGKPTREAAKGMLAKVHLTMATAPLNLGASSYQKARDMAEDLMNDGTVSLIPNVYDVFKKENQYASEMLYSFHSAADDPFNTNASAQIWAPDEIGGWGDFSIDPIWAENWFTRNGQYQWTATDSANLLTSPIEPRWEAYLLLGDGSTPFWEFDDEGERRPYIGKFLMPYITSEEFDTERPVTNMPILRYADVLLVYAEAENAVNGPTASAYDAANQVRRRAFNQPLTTPVMPGVIDLDPSYTQVQFDSAVVEERNWELCFEFDRWFDIQRKRLLDEVVSERPDYAANFSENDYLFPIPTFDAGIVNIQNPGYVTGN